MINLERLVRAGRPAFVQDSRAGLDFLEEYTIARLKFEELSHKLSGRLPWH